MLEAFGKDPERERLNSGDCFITTRGIADRAREVGNFRNPAAVVLALEFDRKAHAHGGQCSTEERYPGRARREFMSAKAPRTPAEFARDQVLARGGRRPLGAAS